MKVKVRLNADGKIINGRDYDQKRIKNTLHEC